LTDTGNEPRESGRFHGRAKDFEKIRRGLPGRTFKGGGKDILTKKAERRNIQAAVCGSTSKKKKNVEPPGEPIKGHRREGDDQLLPKNGATRAPSGPGRELPKGRKEDKRPARGLNSRRKSVSQGTWRRRMGFQRQPNQGNQKSWPADKGGRNPLPIIVTAEGR